jgi:enoyl-CoA hydratase/carnithine racemase
MKLRRRDFVTLLGGGAVFAPFAVRAQQPIRRIGVLMAYAEGDPEGQTRVTAFRERLQKLGWTEGSNIRIDTRWATADVVFDAYGAMRNCPIPIIAVVQGGAHGFGCAIAAACDITLASDKATFSVPEMAHQIMPTMVMSSFVDRVPRKAMAYLVYSMFEVSAERALSYGIVSDVVPAAELDATVDKLTAAMLKAPTISLRSAKEYVRTAPDMPVAGAVEYARNLHATINSAAEIRKPR